MPVPTIQRTVAIPNARDSVPYGHESIDLDDVEPSQDSALPSEGQCSPAHMLAPAYAGPQQREIIQQPGTLPTYQSINPAAGSVDLALPRDAGSIPGTVYENIMAGPVSGRAIDNSDVGFQQRLMMTPPGQIGPVVGGEDYSILVANANYQEAFAVYSNGPSDQAIIAAI
ncbi:MAG: hypothetical protein ACYCZF_13820 [Anaerolineae bacterium]